MPVNGAITAMLADVAAPEEAAIALAGGADILHLSDGSHGGLPLAQVTATIDAVAGRRRVSASVAFLAKQPDRAAATAALAAAGVDGIMLPVHLAAWDPGAIQALASAAAPAQLIAVLCADRERDLRSAIPTLAAAGFQGLMLDTAEPGSGRLIACHDAGALAAFITTARGHGLLVGLAGSLETPDVPRLLALRPDFLGFRSALRAAQDPNGPVKLEAVQLIRALIPLGDSPEEVSLEDEHLPAARARMERNGGRDVTDRVFVRDFVLPVMIGAYKNEHSAPQKVRFDVSVDVDRARDAPHGLAQIFSYDLLTDGIRAIIAAGHIELVESLADRIAALALRHKRAKRVTVRVEKLERGPGGVGVEVVVERPSTEAGLQVLLASLEESAPNPRV